jgi:hypothetical protein
MSQWLPSRKEFTAQVILFLLFPISSGVLAGLESVPYWAIVLIVLGTILLGLSSIAVYEHLRRPYRRRILEGKQLIDMIDAWLRDNGYTRGPITLNGYSHGISAQVGGYTVWIAKEDNRNVLAFISGRIEGPVAAPHFDTLDQSGRTNLKYDIAMELARFSVLYSMTDNPLTVAFWTNLAVDETLSEAKVLDRVNFIQSADLLVQLIAGRATGVDLHNQPSTPQTVGSQ